MSQVDFSACTQKKCPDMRILVFFLLTLVFPIAGFAQTDSSTPSRKKAQTNSNQVQKQSKSTPATNTAMSTGKHFKHFSNISSAVLALKRFTLLGGLILTGPDTNTTSAPCLANSSAIK